MADLQKNLSVIPPVPDSEGEEALDDSPLGQQDGDYIEERLAQLNLTGASIRDSCPGDTGIPERRGAPSIVLPHQEASYVRHIAVDIGGSLIKLVYFSPDSPEQPLQSGQPRGGRMHFVKFESARVQDCLDFIEAKGLHRCYGKDGMRHEVRVKATGGGAIRFADLFKERLGLVLEREDEISCAVRGCSFLLKTITHEAFTYSTEKGPQFVSCSCDEELFPYLLVNIGSGVSIIKVDGEGQYERVSGSSVGGGTFWGLCRLLTGLRDFDDMLELSAKGNHANVDMLVGDIYGGRDYSNIGLSASTIASSFGKVVGQDKELVDYNPADISMALCRMVAYNIGQLAYMNAKRFNLKRLFFGGFFIRGHPYTMETISFAIRFWSKGEMHALFLRHEGFLGAVGAFLKVHPMPVHGSSTRPLRSNASASTKVRARFVERFSMGAPFAGGEVRGPVIKDMSDRVSWVEKFVQVGSAAHQQQPEQPSIQVPPYLDRQDSQPISPMHPSRMALHVGVLHYTPTQEPFPLLLDPTNYVPNTIDINKDEEEYKWLLKVLSDQIPTVVEKAIASEGGGDGPRRRGQAFGRAFAAHLAKLEDEPGCYGQLGLSELFEMREECLREFGFSDVYRLDKERENQVALQVLPDLLSELDQLPPRERLLSLVQGILAANIFDWGAKACVELYTNGTILDIYREARRSLSQRPWRVDDFDAFCEAVYGPEQRDMVTQQQQYQIQEGHAVKPPEQQGQPQGIALDRTGSGGSSSASPFMNSHMPAAAGAAGLDSPPGSRSEGPFRRVMIAVDNAGADVVLGMLPFVREMLRLGCEVVLIANTLPAINDITAPELRSLLSAASELCPIIKAGRQAAKKHEGTSLAGHVPPYPGLRQRQSSHHDLASLAGSSRSPPSGNSGVLTAAALAGGRSSPVLQRVHSSSGGGSSSGGKYGNSGAAGGVGHAVGAGTSSSSTAGVAPPVPAVNGTSDSSTTSRSSTDGAGNVSLTSPLLISAGISVAQQQQHIEEHPISTTLISSCGHGVVAGSSSLGSSIDRAPKLYVVANGHGGPCLDLSRVPGHLADATVGVDLLVIEGMGRAIHTNLHAQFKCDCLKLAMIKTERIGKKLFNGRLYDCMCKFQRGVVGSRGTISGSGGSWSL